MAKVEPKPEPKPEPAKAKPDMAEHDAILGQVHGWAKAWNRNPAKPGWLVCRLTEQGYRALGKYPPRRSFDG